jgi:hypothetical protein
MTLINSDILKSGILSFVKVPKIQWNKWYILNCGHEHVGKMQNWNIFSNFVTFWSSTFFSLTFCSLTFYSSTFYSSPFCSSTFCSLTFCSLTFCSSTFCSSTFCSSTFCSSTFRTWISWHLFSTRSTVCPRVDAIQIWNPNSWICLA